jgi:hypothetical protein
MNWVIAGYEEGQKGGIFSFSSRVRGARIFALTRPALGEAYWAYVSRPWVSPSAQASHIKCQQNSPLGLLILPKILKSFGRQLSVSNGVLDIFVPEVMLQRPGILTIVGELEPASMAKHVRMN